MDAVKNPKTEKKRRIIKTPIIEIVKGNIISHENVVIQKDGTILPIDKRFKSHRIKF